MAIEDNRINTFLKNANELLIHPLRDSLVKGNTLAQEDDGDNHDSVNTQKVASLNNDTDTKGISTIIDKIVANDIFTSHPATVQPVLKHQLHTCGECGAGYRWKSDLKLHRLSKHEGVRYPCNQCDYLAISQRNCNVHKQSVHQGVKYSCELCDYTASMPKSVKRHTQSKHTSAKYLGEQLKIKSMKVILRDTNNSFLGYTLFL